MCNSTASAFLPSVSSSTQGIIVPSRRALTVCQAATSKLRLLVPIVLRTPVRLTAGVRQQKYALGEIWLPDTAH